jgi:fructose-bisphosphate aldolase class II
MLSLKQAIDALNAKHAQSAIGAFSFNDMIDMQAIMLAAMKTHQPCIMMASAGTVTFMGVHFVREMFQAARMTSTVPLYLMLDHSESVDTCATCIDNGFSLVMYDGSSLPFDENVRNTREVIRIAHARGVLVEAEIGRLPGREERPDITSAEAPTTDPREAGAFWEQTGSDLLAISFGTRHGFYKKEPHLNFDVIRKTREITDAPLVMHGGTGVPDDDVRTAISCGVKKVNVGTELKHAYTTALRRALAEQEDEIDPRKILVQARDAVQKAVEDRLAVINTPRVEQLA